MARKKNPINDIIDAAGAWLGGNRGSVPSSGAGAAWQASARSAAQNANQRIVKGLEEGVVQFGAYGMGTSAQTQRDLMYGVPGAATQATKEAAVSQVTGLAVGYVVGKVANKAVQKAVESGVAARVMNKVTGQRVIVHGTNSQLKNLKTGKPLEFDVLGRPLDRGAVLEPRAGSAGSPDKPVVFGWNPQQRASNARPVIYSSPEMYATKGESATNPQIVVGKVKSKKTRFRDPDLLGNPKGKNVVEASAPVKIESVVKYDDNYMDNLERALKRAGAPVPLDFTRVEKIQQRIKNKRNFKKGIL